MAHTESTYNLNSEERELLDSLISDAKALEQQSIGALRMICKVRGLEGDWMYNGGVLKRRASSLEVVAPKAPKEVKEG